MFILDRFEEDLAFLEGPEGVFSVARSQVGASVREGDVLLLQDGVYQTDAAATTARRARMKSLLGRIKRR